MPCRLYAGSRLLGELTALHSDYPKTWATFTPTTEFNEVRELFNQQNEQRPGSRAAIDALDLRFVWSEGAEERARTVYIAGDRAMWRIGFFRSVRVHNHDVLWRVLGAEIGPDRCRREGCVRLIVQSSVFCRQHHFRMIMGEEYDGTERV